MAKTMVQPVTGTQSWRERMKQARAKLKLLFIGQQDVLLWIAEEQPELDRLTFYTRWKNAWSAKNADPEFTELVERAADHFKNQTKKTRQRLGRQRLKTQSEV